MWKAASSDSEEGSNKVLLGLMNRHTLNSEPSAVTINATSNNANGSTVTTATVPEQHVRSLRKDLPPLFWFMETGDWEKAVERIRRHPKEVKTWATLRTKSAADVTHVPVGDGASSPPTSTTKRLALHHACFKLRAAGVTPPTYKDDPFVEVCRFILLLVKLDPDAVQKRESRHGCLPLHLAAFASSAPREASDECGNVGGESESSSHNELLSMSSLHRPGPVAKRQSSDATNETQQTNMSAMYAEENYTGAMSDIQMRRVTTDNPNVSVAMRTNAGGLSAKREEMLIQVINALLDAYPKAARVDSEGGRLPLHTACAGRATPRVVTTLITAYPAAARQRNKDGFLPLHLAAHWGVSHISVAVQLLKVYPDATVGRNRWERTPLEEALCMAGENGRPHQAALVRALRKHPSWWTRPQSDFRINPLNNARAPAAVAGRSGGGGGGGGVHHAQLHPRLAANTAVDIDESLPSNDSTFDEYVRMHQHDQRTHCQYEDDILAFDLGDDLEYPQSPPSPSPGLMQRLSPMTLLGKNKKGSIDTVIPDPLGVGVSLAHLIERRQWSIIVARIRQDPLEAEQELQVMTRGGFMASTGMSPLHFACERQPPPEVIRLLIEAFPVATLTRAMPGGCLPLHIACTWGGSSDIVKVLLSADTGSVRVKDELGNVALHSACFSGADIRVIEALVLCDSKSVLARNHQGSRPLDICKRLRHENRRFVMSLLSKKRDDVVRSHNRDGSSGLLSDIAREAEAMNQRAETPGSNVPRASAFRDSEDQQEHQAGGVEVTYDDKGNGQDELLWI